MPAILCGFALSFPAIGFLYTNLFKEKLQNGFEVQPTFKAVLYALFIGFCVPLLSTIMPILNLMKQSLVDSLDYERSRLKSLVIEVLDASKYNMIPQLAFGLLTSIYGGLIYYFLPYSMLANKINLILSLFFIVLMGLLFGLCILAFNV